MGKHGVSKLVCVSMDYGKFVSCSCGWSIKGLRSDGHAKHLLKIHRAKCNYTGEPQLAIPAGDTRYKGTKYDKSGVTINSILSEDDLKNKSVAIVLLN